METANPHWAYTVACYAAIAVALGVWYITRGDRRRTRQTPQRDTTTPQSKERSETAAARTKRRDSRNPASDASGSERQTVEPQARRSKAKKATSPKKRVDMPAPQREATSVEANDGTNDREYAESMAVLRKGNKLAPPARSEARSRTVRQANANSSGANSSAGADADDDLSPARSPALGHATGATEIDVSDMLEAAAPAPTVLRVAPKQEKAAVVQERGWETVGKQPRDTVKKAAVAESETKKQRQNKKRSDEQKTQIEEAERLRQQKLEQQRRTAREARGEAAKDGSSRTAPAVNQWNERKLNGGAVQAPAPAAPPALLDTFDNDGASTASSKDAAPTWSPKSESTANTSWEKDLPDEQEQLRLIREQDDSAWNTVTDKKKKRKQAKADSAISNDSDDTSTAVPKSHGLTGLNIIKHEDVVPQHASDDDAGWSVA